MIELELYGILKAFALRWVHCLSDRCVYRAMNRQK